jgi:MarR family transcriptional regulator, organic hydroperoxide resistance regulator
LSSINVINYNVKMMATAAAVDNEAREAWGLLWELMLARRSKFVALMGELDLTAVQGIVLRRLDPHRPTPMNEIAEHLACDASNVTGLVDRLESRGLVERRAAPTDRRVKTLVLTPEGIALRRRVIERMSQPPDEIARLSRADQRSLRDILRRAMVG